MCDFGLAKDTHSDNLTHTAKGTAAYMSPELWKAEDDGTADAFYKADVYVVSFFLLSLHFFVCAFLLSLPPSFLFSLPFLPLFVSSCCILPTTSFLPFIVSTWISSHPSLLTFLASLRLSFLQVRVRGSAQLHLHESGAWL